MPIRKKGNIEIQTSANGTKTKPTGFTFYSYDKNSAALYFNFREENGEPTDLADSTIRLVFVLNDKKITPKTDDIEIWLAVPGAARYIIPESMLGHEGKVTGYVYLEFSDGSHTDEGRFTFEIKRSLITDVIPEAGDKYVKDFEDIKAEVQEAADGAKETISQKVTEVSETSDSAISKVNQVADGAIKTASEAKSDVQNKAGEASEDISNLVKTTEDARDDAVESMYELDYSDRNLLISSKLKSHLPYSTQPVVKDNGKEITTKVVEHGNSAIVLKIDGFKPQNKKYTLSGKIEINGKPITKQTFRTKRLNLYHDKDVNERFEVYDDGTLIATETYDPANDKGLILDTNFDGVTDGDTITFYDLQFQPGSVATPWQPSFGDYDAKIKKLEEAITNLGGSI